MEEIYTNQIYSKSFIITLAKFPIKIYYPISDATEIDIDEFNNFDGLSKLIEKYHNKRSIIIDSRLEYLIIVTEMIYPNYCLIYNISSHKVEKFVDFFSSSHVLDLKGLFIYTRDKYKIMDLYLFIKYYCGNLSISWNTSTAIEACQTSKNINELILNYIKIHSFIDISNEDKSKLIKKFKSIIDSQFTIYEENIFESIDQLFTILMLLNTSNINIKLY